MNKKQALYEQVANTIIEQLEKGTSPWLKPWSDSERLVSNMPYNPTTDKNYKGMNSLWLMMQERIDPRWMTFKQAQANGWQVKKGEKAKTINFVKLHDLRPILDENGKPVLDEKGKPIKRMKKLAYPIITTAWVFNAEQISGMPPLEQVQEEKRNAQKWTSVERAEILAVATKAIIKHGGNSAYYSVSTDHIQMPEKDQFKTASGYYGTLFHEIGHWTGDSSRLDRDMSGRKGNAKYAKEELIAEIASFMIRSEIGLDRELNQTAAYAKSWIQVLKDDPYEIFKAASSAQKIYDYVFEFERELQLTKGKHSSVLITGDEIKYKDKTYLVGDKTGKSGILVSIKETGDILKVTPKDGLYSSLVSSKNGIDKVPEIASESSLPIKNERLEDNINIGLTR